MYHTFMKPTFITWKRNQMPQNQIESNVWFTTEITDSVEKKFQSVVHHHENVIKLAHSTWQMLKQSRTHANSRLLRLLNEFSNWQKTPGQCTQHWDHQHEPGVPSQEHDPDPPDQLGVHCPEYGSCDLSR
jgi:hypothetical protein